MLHPTETLIRWIDSHYTAAPTIDNGDGTLTVSTVSVDREGRVFTERDTIPATLSAARDLMGY
ncbi:hypothetical protein SY91_01748 [Burkholderia cenocepacia]|uniref:hypothetical protein n=1 Tax=Burkholderia cenocepacia TaxID=95486 RepID=UPI00163C317D|nr:hypothetical protein [Burkholderia cenocepacia]QND94349.1 hypothetical protein SY91_01748 [Burkholderia cenocepacia]